MKTTSDITGYKVFWSNGQIERFDTLDEAEAAVREVLPAAEIGHDGDIRDGGERTLFWVDDEAAEDDDGSHAAGSIAVLHRA